MCKALPLVKAELPDNLGAVLTLHHTGKTAPAGMQLSQHTSWPQRVAVRKLQRAVQRNDGFSMAIDCQKVVPCQGSYANFVISKK